MRIVWHRILATPQRQMTGQDVQVRVIVVKEQALHEKRLVGLPPEILVCKILLAVWNTIINSFMNLQLSLSALLHRG